MNISRRPLNEEDTPCDDGQDVNPKLRMIESYLVVPSRRLEKLIASYDDCSTVDLSCQKLTDRDMAVILKHAVLEKRCQILNLWGNRFTFESVRILSNVLDGNRTLIELDLSHNRLLDRGVQIISEVLSLNTSVLKEIDLSSNNITNQGAEYLANMLKKNNRLKRLALNGNEITDYGLLLLGNALVEDNQKLIQLKLEGNPGITRNGVIDVLKLLRNNRTLEDIYVKDCSIHDRDFDMLEKMSFTTGFDIIVSNRTYIYGWK